MSEWVYLSPPPHGGRVRRKEKREIGPLKPSTPRTVCLSTGRSPMLRINRAAVLDAGLSDGDWFVVMAQKNSTVFSIVKVDAAHPKRFARLYAIFGGALGNSSLGTKLKRLGYEGGVVSAKAEDGMIVFDASGFHRFKPEEPAK